MSTQDIIHQLKDSTGLSVIATILLAMVGFLSAAMANRRVAVFNDGLRPLVGEEKHGRFSSKALAGTSVAMGIGYVIGFVPISITSGFLIVHIVLLASDMLGVSLPHKKENNGTFIDKYKYTIISGLLGLAFALAIFWGIKGIDKALDKLAYKGFGWDLGQINTPFGAVFALFPAVAVGLQHGWKKGLLTASASILIYISFAMLAIYLGNTGHPDLKNVFKIPEAWALLVGIIFLLFFAFFSKKSKEMKKDKGQILPVFEQNSNEIMKNKWWFALSGSLIGMTVVALGFVESPASAPLYQSGNLTSALLTEGTRALGFIPLVILTSLATGVYSPAGTKLDMFLGTASVLIGTQIVKSTGNIHMYYFAFIIAGILSGGVMLLEVIFIKQIAVWLDKYQGVKDASGHIRTSITRALNYLLLAGATIAAWTIGLHMPAAQKIPHAGSYFAIFGVVIVIGFALMNKLFTKPLPEMAVGPTALIIFGVIANIIRFIPLA